MNLKLKHHLISISTRDLPASDSTGEGEREFRSGVVPILVVIVVLFLIAHASPAATVSWIGGSGDWNTPANWSSAPELPGPDDDVVMDVPGLITVTHSSGAHTVKSLLCQEAFTLSGGLLSVLNTVRVNNGFTLSGGSLVGATVIQGTNGHGMRYAGGGVLLDGLTLNGDLDLTSGSGVNVTVTNGLALNGTATVGNLTNQSYAALSFAGSQTLSGNGTVVFGNNNNLYNTMRVVSGGTTLTLGPGITVRGQNGTIGYGIAWGGPQNVGVVSQGTISADVAAGTIMLIAQPFTNNGLIRSPAGTVVLGGTIAGGLGVFDSSGGSVLLTGTLDNTGTSLILTGPANALRLEGGMIRGGNITTTNGARLIGNSGTLDGVTLNGDLDLTTVNGASVTVANGLVLNGTAWVGNPTNHWYAGLHFSGSQTLSGNGTVVFGNNNNLYNTMRVVSGGTTLTLGPGITVRGQNGTLGYGNAWGGPQNVGVVNQGTISADVSAGTIMLIAQPFMNTGLVRSPTGTINLAGTVQSSGLGMFDSSGGAVLLTGLLDNMGASVLLNGPANALRLEGGTIRSGTITTTNGARFIGNGGTLDAVTLNGDLDLTTVNGASVTVVNGLVLNGTAWVGNPTNHWYAGLHFSGSQTLSGNGTVVFGNNNNLYNTMRVVSGGTTLTLGPGITVRGQNGTLGYGNAWGGPQNVGVINQGTISADVSAGTIMLIAQPFTNNGLIRSPAGTVVLGGTIAGGVGTIEAGGGGIVLNGRLDNTNRTLVVDGGINTLMMQGAVIAGGSIVTTNGASLVVIALTLDGVTMIGDLDVGNANNGASLTVLNGLVLNGTLRVGNSTNSWWGNVNFQGSQTLSGNGTVIFGNYGCYNSLRPVSSGMSLTLGPGITVRGHSGSIGQPPCLGGPQDVSVVNQGAILADVPGGTISVVGQPVSNSGVMRMTNGGNLSINYLVDAAGLTARDGGALVLSGPWRNTGLLTALDGSILQFDGTWTNAGTIRITNATLNLGGTFTTAGLGTLQRSGGVVALMGTLNNTNSTLALNAGTGSWLMSGGSVRGGTLATSGGAQLVFGGGTLDGVTVNGDLDVGNVSNGASLTVVNGLVLNGTLRVGNPTNYTWGYVNFQGSQTLSGNGTVIFGIYGCYNSLLASSGMTLGPGITVRGHSGYIGRSPCVGGAQSVSVVNQGTVSADAGGIIVIDCQSFANTGAAQAVNGGRLVLVSGWTNAGTLHVEMGTLDLGGTFTLAALGVFTATGGVVNLNGTLINNGTTLALNDATGPWVLNGGRILGGTVQTTSSAALTASYGVLDGVTVNGDLDVGNQYNGAQLTVTNGLVLNGTLRVGNSTNSWYGIVNFEGTQTLSGSATVVFGNHYYNALRLVLENTALTLGPGTTVRGQSGTIGFHPSWGGPPTVSVRNEGTISADAGGTITIYAQPFTNGGLVRSPSGIVNIAGTCTGTGLGIIQSVGGTVALVGLLDNSGHTLLLSGTSNGLTVQGGTIRSGTITTTNGARLIVGYGLLDGATLNGDLDVGSAINGAVLTVTNGLVLNGTLRVGNPTNSSYGRVDFLGTQTLSGNGAVVFGNYYYYNALRLALPNTTLTLGAGIIVRGHSGAIGYHSTWGGPQNVSVINQGTVSADAGGTITLDAYPFRHHGNIQAPDGIVGLRGLLDNRGTNFVLDGPSAVLTMLGGTLWGGTVVTANGGRLAASSSGGDLDEVTLQGDLDMTQSPGARLLVYGGLLLRGTARVGNPTNGWPAALSFAGDQALTGIGTVIFGNSPYNALRMEIEDTTLVIDSGITIRGTSGTIGYEPSYWGGPVFVEVMNFGSISADDAGGSIILDAMPYYQLGRITAPAGVVGLRGLMDNRGTNFVLDGPAAVLTLMGGSLWGGTVIATNGGALAASNSGGDLEEVTLNGDLDLTRSSVARILVYGGLTLNGTARVGNPTNGGYAALSFAGNQSLAGNGTVIFGNSPYNAMRLELAGSQLTLGSGISVRGQNGTIGYALRSGLGRTISRSCASVRCRQMCRTEQSN